MSVADLTAVECWLDEDDDDDSLARAVIECIWARHLLSFGMLSLFEVGKSERGDEDEDEDEVVDDRMMLNLKPLSVIFLRRPYFFRGFAGAFCVSVGTNEHVGGDVNGRGVVAGAGSVDSLNNLLLEFVTVSSSELGFENVFNSNRVYSSSSAAEVLAESLQISSIMASISYGLLTDSFTMERKLESPDSLKL